VEAISLCRGGQLAFKSKIGIMAGNGPILRFSQAPAFLFLTCPKHYTQLFVLEC